MFDALKLTKEDLQNKDIMGVIIEETVINQAKRQAEQESNKGLQQKIQKAQLEINKEESEFK